MKGQNNGKQRKVRANNEKIMDNPPDGVNAYKNQVRTEGETITIQGTKYKYITKPSHRLTRRYGHLIEELRDDKRRKTGETKKHMRFSVQLVRA